MITRVMLDTTRNAIDRIVRALGDDPMTVLFAISVVGLFVYLVSHGGAQYDG